MFVAVRSVRSVKPLEQRTTTLMLDFLFKAQFTIAVTHCPSKLRFQAYQTLDLLAHIHQFALEHGLHFGTGVMFLPQRQQFFNLVQGEAQLLRMPYKLEVANLFPIKEAIPAGAPRRSLSPSRSLSESDLLVEADRIHTDTCQLCGLSDVNRFCHPNNKDKPWSHIQSQERTWEANESQCRI